MLTVDVANYIKQYEAAPNHVAQYEAMSGALDAMTTREDFECCLGLLGDRQMGNYIADNADDMDSNPDWGNGIALMELNEDITVVSEWDSQGFYHVSLQTPAKAYEMLQEFYENNSYEPGEDEED